MSFTRPICQVAVIMGLIMAGCQSQPAEQPPSAKTTGHKPAQQSLVLSGGWARPASSGANSAAYLRISNNSDTSDTLLAVQAPAAGNASVHESYEKDGLSGMRRLGDLPIDAATAVVFQPGGYHIMLMNLKQSVALGDSLTLRLQFKLAGQRLLKVPVQLQQPKN